jgi:hypothetical protein
LVAAPSASTRSVAGVAGVPTMVTVRSVAGRGSLRKCGPAKLRAAMASSSASTTRRASSPASGTQIARQRPRIAGQRVRHEDACEAQQPERRNFALARLSEGQPGARAELRPQRAPTGLAAEACVQCADRLEGRVGTPPGWAHGRGRDDDDVIELGQRAAADAALALADADGRGFRQQRGAGFCLDLF